MTRQQQTPNSGTGTPIHQIHPTHHSHPLILVRSHKPVIHTANLLYMYKRQPLTLMLLHFHLTCTKLLPLHLHKITKVLITTQINNKCAHHQHNPLMYSFHNLSTLMFPCHTFHNIHLLTVHLHIVLILRSC